MIALLLGIQGCEENSVQALRMARNHPTLAVLDQLLITLSSTTALTTLELDFDTSDALRTVSDRDYPESLRLLLSNVKKPDNNLRELTLGNLYSVTAQASLDSTMIHSTRDHYQKLEETAEHFRELNSMLGNSNDIINTGEIEIDNDHNITIASLLLSTDESSEADRTFNSKWLSKSDSERDEIIGSAVVSQTNVDLGEPERAIVAKDYNITTPSFAVKDSDDFTKLCESSVHTFQAMSKEINRLLRPNSHSSPKNQILRSTLSPLQQTQDTSTIHYLKQGTSNQCDFTPTPNSSAQYDDIHTSELSKMYEAVGVHGTEYACPINRSTESEFIAVSNEANSVVQNADGTLTVTPRALKAIVDGAVTTALESAHKQWFQHIFPPSDTTATTNGTSNFSKESSNIMSTPNSGKVIDNFARRSIEPARGEISSRVSDRRGSRFHTLSNSFITANSVGQYPATTTPENHEQQYIISELERKIDGFERRLMEVEQNNGDLEGRMNSLEAAVESEHESSIHVLDIILQQQQAQSNGDVHKSAWGSNINNYSRGDSSNKRVRDDGKHKGGHVPGNRQLDGSNVGIPQPPKKSSQSRR